MITEESKSNKEKARCSTLIENQRLRLIIAKDLQRKDVILEDDGFIYTEDGECLEAFYYVGNDANNVPVPYYLLNTVEKAEQLMYNCRDETAFHTAASALQELLTQELPISEKGEQRTKFINRRRYTLVEDEQKWLPIAHV